MSKWTATVQEDPDDPEGCIIVFPEDMIAELEWKDGDTLDWQVQDDRTAIISKVNK